MKNFFNLPMEYFFNGKKHMFVVLENTNFGTKLSTPHGEEIDEIQNQNLLITTLGNLSDTNKAKCD